MTETSAPVSGEDARGTIFTVTADVPREVWDDFNEWYHEEHLPLAATKLGAARAARLVSAEHGVHIATYYFSRAVGLGEILTGSNGVWLKSEFDAKWGDRVSRTWQVLEVADLWRSES